MPEAPVPLSLVKDLARHLRAGHPWVFSRALERPPRGLPAGAIVDLTEGGRFVARGYYDPHSPIAVRVLTRDPADAIDANFWRRRVAQAARHRERVLDLSATDAYRVVHGEGDHVPGVVVDRYADFAVIKLYSAGLATHRAAILDAVRSALPVRGIYSREEAARDDDPATAGDENPKGSVAWGAAPPERITIREEGVPFLVDVRLGQKTGFFLDQRENRRALRRYARGRARALNCFGYTGGFSVQAALGGAAQVTTVDQDADALALARENFSVNGLDPNVHEFVPGDVFAFLADCKARGEKYDLVVLDPPAFAKSQRTVDAALAGYASLHRAALAVLSQGGILATASCSARVTPEAFLEAVKEAAFKSHTDLSLLEARGQAPDHPVPMQFQEGRYLKFFVLARM